jgi:hypothetical protein
MIRLKRFLDFARDDREERKTLQLGRGRELKRKELMKKRQLMERLRL